MLVTLQMPLALGLAHWAFIIPICLLSIFLTLLILVQRGRGGGLTGALGGMGGQSAFGTKAGDVFTKITIVTAMLWILLSMGALRFLHVGKFSNTGGPPAAKTNTDKKAEDGKGGSSPPLTPEAPPADPVPPAPTTPAPAPPAPAATPPATEDKTDDNK